MTRGYKGMFCGLVLGSMAYVFGLAQTRRTKTPFMRGSLLWVCECVPELPSSSLGEVVFELLFS